MKKLVLRVEGLSCPVCTEKIGDMLNKIKGIEKADVFFNTGKAKISYMEEEISPEEITGAIKKLVYKAKQS